MSGCSQTTRTGSAERRQHVLEAGRPLRAPRLQAARLGRLLPRQTLAGRRLTFPLTFFAPVFVRHIVAFLSEASGEVVLRVDALICQVGHKPRVDRDVEELLLQKFFHLVEL